MAAIFRLKMTLRFPADTPEPTTENITDLLTGSNPPDNPNYSPDIDTHSLVVPILFIYLYPMLTGNPPRLLPFNNDHHRHHTGREESAAGDKYLAEAGVERHEFAME